MLALNRSALDTMPRLAVPGAAWVLIAVVIVFGLTAPAFNSTANASNVATQATLLLLLALPMTFVIMTEGLDLSLGAMLSLATVVMAVVLKLGVSTGLALALCLFVGLVFGVVNGALVGVLGIPPFVATLGTMGIVSGLALVCADGRDLVGMPGAVTALWNGTVEGVPAPVVIAVGMYTLFHVFLYHTRFGIAVIALGGNREALRLAGRHVTLLTLAVYGLAGLCAALGGALLAGRIDGGNPTAGIGMEFDAIAAVVVGGTSFAKGKGTLFGTLIGSLLITVLRNGLNLLALPSSMQVAAVGVLAIAALAFESKRSK